MGHPRDVGAERLVALTDVEAFERQQLGARPLAHRRLADRAQPQTAREPPLALARAARQRRDASRVAPEQRHDPIGLAVVHGAQDDRGCGQRDHASAL